MSQLPFLPYARQAIEDADIEAVVAVLKSDFLTTGPVVAQFEAAVAEKTGAAHPVAVSSGTAALHVALMAADCGEDQAWIVPSVSFVASANAVRYCGGEVLFADVDPETGLMRASDLEEALERCLAAGRKPSGVVPVHLGGQVTEMTGIAELARKHNLIVVEDAAHAVGSRYGGSDGTQHTVGGCAHSDMTTLSFHPVKTATMGEGGVVTTKDAALAERFARLRSHGIERDPARFRHPEMASDESGNANGWYYELQELGYNYRATDIQCALGLSQLSRLESFVDARARLREAYPAALPPGVRLVPTVGPQKPAWHLATALIDFDAAGLSRAQVMAGLRERGIGTQVHYIPIHLQPYYRDRYGETRLPGAENYYSRCLSLPLFYGMTDADVTRVGAALAEVLDSGRRA